MTTRELMESQGWKFEDVDNIAVLAKRKFPKHEICIEFCMGGVCLGIYDENFYTIEKKHYDSLFQALCEAELLYEKYILNNNQND